VRENKLWNHRERRQQNKDNILKLMTAKNIYSPYKAHEYIDSSKIKTPHDNYMPMCMERDFVIKLFLLTCSMFNSLYFYIVYYFNWHGSKVCEFARNV
jgi:hypothetical protein